MLCTIILTSIALVGFEAIDKLEKKERLQKELKKAEEEGYEVFISY